MAERGRRSFAFAATVLLAAWVACAGVGCACMRSAVNSSESLRWWLFSSFGASRICPELQKRGVPIKVQPLGAASVGRYFPSQCQATVDEGSHTVAVRVAGTGYASLPVARRIGFYAAAAVELRPDFRMEDDATYVWGRFNRMVSPPDLRLLGVENPVVGLATQTPLGDVATLLAQGLVTSELARGFTVVRRDDGDDFALGILTPPALPPRPFQPGKGRVLLASDVSFIGASAREYLGPFEITGGNAALFVHVRTDGAPLVFGLVDRATGDGWRRTYEGAQPLGPPPAAPAFSGTLAPGQGELAFPLSPGAYYLVLENRAPPPLAPLGLPIPGVESVSYATWGAEVGDRR